VYTVIDTVYTVILLNSSSDYFLTVGLVVTAQTTSNTVSKQLEQIKMLRADNEKQADKITQQTER